MFLEIKNLNFKFYSISSLPLKNGDVNFFGFFSSPIFKSYGFLSQNQINHIQKDFDTIISEEFLSFPKETANFWGKSIALSEKKQFNVGYLFLIKENNKLALNKIKKFPFLELVLSDQPEIFYNIKQKHYSYKKINNFRFSDFSFDADFFKRGRDKNSNCYKMKDFKSSQEITSYILGESFSPKAKKTIMTHILHKRWGDIVVNYQMIRIVEVLKKMFSTDFICYAIDNHLSKMVNCTFLKDIEWSGLHSEKISFGPIKYLNHFTDEKTRFNEMLRFNVPQHIFDLFSQVMKSPFDTLKPDILKESDALYFFNNLSRDYGRLKNKNFTLKVIQKKSYVSEIKDIDGLIHQGYTYKVAKDYHTLIEWGSQLRNCAGNFHSSENYKEMLLIGIFKGTEILYLASLKGDSYKRIDQLEGFKNSVPKKDILKVLFEPFVKIVSNPKENFESLIKIKKESQ